MRFNPERHFGKKDEEELNPEAAFCRRKEGFETQNNFEKLNIYTDLAIRINDLYNKRLLGKREAEMLMGYLRKYSEGRDKDETVKLMAILDDADLYLKERLIEVEDKEIFEKNLEEDWKRVQEVMKNPPALEEIEAINKKADELFQKVIEGGSVREYYDEVEKIKEPGEVIVSSLEVLREILIRIKISKEMIEDMIEHERSHLLEAKKFGLISEPAIIIWKERNGKKAARCRVIQKLPDDMSDEEIIRAVKAITGAPVDISDSDEKQLKDLDKVK